MTLDINSEIYGSHGLSGEGDAHENEKYKVVGILKPTGTVIDRLLLTDINSVLKIHGHEKIKEFSNDVVHNHNIEIEEKIGHSEILHDDHHEDHHHKSHDHTKHHDDEKHYLLQKQENKKNIIWIFGDSWGGGIHRNEVENKTLTVRRRFIKDQKELSLDDFSNEVLTEINERRVSN